MTQTRVAHNPFLTKKPYDEGAAAIRLDRRLQDDVCFVLLISSSGNPGFRRSRHAHVKGVARRQPPDFATPKDFEAIRMSEYGLQTAKEFTREN
jgi:hypothetical protein